LFATKVAEGCLLRNFGCRTPTLEHPDSRWFAAKSHFAAKTGRSSDDAIAGGRPAFFLLSEDEISNAGPAKFILMLS
jgi:hypothetical protein